MFTACFPFTAYFLSPACTLKRLLIPVLARSMLLFATAALLLFAMQSKADTTDEAVVRAAMIFNLLKFTKWPETLPADAPLRICAVQASPKLVTALQGLDKRSAGSHPLEMKTASAKELAACQIIVTDAVQIPFALQEVQDHGVLTIGETGFIDRGGMVGITVIDQRVRFEINLEAMRRSGIALPSQVLQLAVRTR